MITGTTYFDLRRGKREQDRDVIRAMYGVPAGTRVVLDVGKRWVVDFETTRWLANYLDTHHLDVHGEPAAVAAWIKALRQEGGTGWE